MKRALVALAFLAVAALSAWAGSVFAPAYPFRLFVTTWDGNTQEIPVYSDRVARFDVYLDYFQVGFYLEPYAVVEMTHGDGSQTYMGVDTNRLTFVAKK